MRMGISVDTYREQLLREGYQRVYLWRDPPGAAQAPHFHTCETVNIVIDGELSLTMGGRTRVLGWGERVDLPPGLMHEAKSGPKGCVFLIGERRPE